MPLTASGTTAAGAAAADARGEDKLRIEMLGAGNEVGRSCCVLTYKGKTVVCDAGVHPAYNGIAALPFIDELDWSTVDALLITHFHLDHAAALTYIMEKTNFKDGKGKVYMTHPTKAVYRFLMSDFVRISNAGSDDRLFDEMEMLASWRQIEAVDFHQDVSVGGGLRFTPYHAGHVLGACMYLIEIAGLRILYTGDFSREEDRHLVQAEIPPVRPDVLISESTYGVQSLEPRLDKEQRFTTMIHNIVSRGGRVLLPVFVLGRAQELLLLLDEYWSAHPELQRIPIYYASSLARKCIGIYQTYIHTMNEHIRSRFNRRDNPFVFKHVSNLRSLDKFEDKGSCVMMASPGFMQSGVSRELLERWAPDRRNGLIVTGYSVEGTMARSILNEPDEIIAMNGQKIPRRMTVDYISFSAHVDYAQNSRFIDEIKAQHIVLVHGEATAMARLRAALQSKFSERSEDVKVHTPKNCEPLYLHFRADRLAKAIGSIAEKPPKAGSVMSGLLVSKDFAYTILDPKDLAEFTGLSTSTIIQRQRVALNVGWEMAKWHLEGMYGGVQEGVDLEGRRTMRIMSALDIKQSGVHELLLEWVSSINNDMVAESALALLLGIDSSPASVKMTTRPHSHDHEHGHSHEHEHEHKATPDGTAASPSAEAEVKHPFADKGTAAIDVPQAEAARGIERANQIAAFLEAYYGNVEEITIGQDPDAEAEAEAEAEAAEAEAEAEADADADAEGEEREEGDKEHEEAAAAAENKVKAEPMDEDLSSVPSAPAPAPVPETDANANASGSAADAAPQSEAEKAESSEKAEALLGDAAAAAADSVAPAGGAGAGADGDTSMQDGDARADADKQGETGEPTAADAPEPSKSATAAPAPPAGPRKKEKDTPRGPRPLPSLEETLARSGPLRPALKVTLDDKVAILDLCDPSALASSDSDSGSGSGSGSLGAGASTSWAVYSRSDALRKRVLHLVAMADRCATSASDAFGRELAREAPMCSQLFMGGRSDAVEPGEDAEGKRDELESGEGIAVERKKIKLEAGM